MKSRIKLFAFMAAATGALLSTSFSVTAKTSAKASSASSTLPAAKLGGARVFVKYYLEYYPVTTTKFGHLLLFPDGTAFDEIPTKPMTSFSEATLRKLVDARYVGKWKQAGKTLVLSFPKEKRTLRKTPRGWFDGKGAIPKDSAYDIYYPVISPPKARMTGAWQNNNLVVLGTAGGGAPMVAGGSSGKWKFNANGTFDDSQESFASATTANMGDAYKPEGDLYSNSNRKRASSGTWRIDGPLLTLEKNGQRTVHLAFLMPYWTKNMANTDLMIDGDRWKRPEKK